ncbi:protein phosphatase CheZ [Herbaspirillum seropedicae]|uniref:Protein phosphatase CheZ n=1 Tax=Herbaspirillum seropedicae (strain SmR1) TaxID=757424 RepID=D8J0M3_HERSS|nr:protein phosphatase CheZ [Herbaspirillum seropedicae]ADJ64579.1 chemotaxis phosphatase protein [Herbaspirillum seropedicae SmR1]AKN66505.1 chemotaxis protein CheZ [Herbaspirillum seropedicae]AON55322.1 chemotaxis phosphatase [Herbaspirillum seropedicae]MDR6393598.1 chemotaxis protein CheZ [Herbaspirillum seropedicae]NQE30395.1 chemotaxis protein CheZ [Herbaspirillum seropedicae]
MSDDVDLEALFDEISAQTLPAMTATGEEAVAQAADGAAEAAAPEDQSDKPMYARLGGIVRLLHDSMRELGYDRSLNDVASQIGDAQSRLEHIATLTEQAANKVLNALDSGMPAQDRLQEQAKDINDRWSRLYAGQMSIDEFKQLAGDSQKFSAAVVESTEAEKARMLEIMMAQDFQDITGQLIKKIVGITTTAERELAQLLRDNAPPEVRAQIEAEKPVSLMNGPASPGTAMGQTDVDDLLDSLGF